MKTMTAAEILRDQVIEVARAARVVLKLAPLTVQQMTDTLSARLPAIEDRVAWLKDRELSDGGSGRGRDTQKKMIRHVSAALADLRIALDLPAAAPPTFDEDFFSG